MACFKIQWKKCSQIIIIKSTRWRFCQRQNWNHLHSFLLKVDAGTGWHIRERPVCFHSDLCLQPTDEGKKKKTSWHECYFSSCSEKFSEPDLSHNKSGKFKSGLFSCVVTDWVNHYSHICVLHNEFTFQKVQHDHSFYKKMNHVFALLLLLLLSFFMH